MTAEVQAIVGDKVLSGVPEGLDALVLAQLGAGDRGG